MSAATEIMITLRLSEQARAKLAEQAANSGQDISTAASDLIERAVTRPSIAEIMAPVRQQVADSGMTDQELDDFLRGQLEDYRREKKAKSA
jgi:predicted DNA binding CopG/RHH family protein